MIRHALLYGLTFVFAAVAFASSGRAADLTIAPDIERRLAQFARTDMRADISALSAEDRAVLKDLLRAAALMDEIFYRQVSSENAALREQLKSLAGPLAEPARQYFEVNKGPWDRLDGNQPFLGTKAKPPGAGFYPEDMSKQEFENWVKAYPERRDAMTSFTTVIGRTPERRPDIVAYSKAYHEWLAPAAEALRAAAAKTSNASLKKFLTLRADAFLSDDYFASDMAWMDLDAPVEVTIGPYESYEDDLFGYKASYEAYVTVALPKESAALSAFKNELPWLERNLPIPEEHKNLKRGTDSPIRVVDIVATSGDGNRGVQSIAYNLPNDERVRQAKGSKKVMLRNIMRAKYDQILVPIAGEVLSPADAKRLSWDAYFNEVLHHELGHGLGPGTITKDGQPTEVRLELKDLYSALEEAKADVMGVYDILALIEKGVMPKALLEALEPTYVAGLFRSARFGVHEAHGQGVVAQFNYLMKKGAIVQGVGDAKGKYRTDSSKFAGGIKDLLHDMLMLEATGDYEGTKKFLETYGQASPEMLQAFERLKKLPVDIRPVYAQAAELAK